MMTPIDHHRSFSFCNVDHINDQYELVGANPTQASASSSSSSLSCSLGFAPGQDLGGSYHWELKNYSEAEKNVSPCGSCDPAIENKERTSGLKLKIKKRDYKRMMQTDQTVGIVPQNCSMKSKDQKQLSSSLETDNSSSNYLNNSNVTVRVCSDCHTTKTPLWRSGPRGPKSLCNACGIRQRKARRAMAAAAAASANGSIMEVMETKRVKGKTPSKEKKSKPKYDDSQFKKQCKLVETTPSSRGGSKEFYFEEFMMKLSNNLDFQQVFPQDEKEAAILLMSLSYGLVHG